MNFLRDLSILVLGLGDSGLAMARWCVQHGGRVTVWDSREAPPKLAALQAELPSASFVTGELLPSMLAGVQLVLKSPGLAPTDPRVAPLLQEARDTAIATLGELDLFCRALLDLRQARDYAPRWLAITGTNGKTTTTAMTALLVQRSGRSVATAGNIGPTLLDTLAAVLARADEGVEPLPDVWVLELSSFQLQGGGFGINATSGFEPDATALLNISQDHLDWHGNMAAYRAAKARIYGVAPNGAVLHTLMVVNRDDPALLALAAAAQPPVPAGKVKVRDRVPDRPVLHFGTNTPTLPGDFGLIVENGMSWLVRAAPLEESLRPGRSKVEDFEIHLQRLMPADALRLRGRHNAANALAALGLATAIGCPLAPMLHALREYAGEPHRMQWVASRADVDAFDDSKGTNVGATVAALLGLGADKAPAKLIVILGGDGKGQDFTPLAAPLLQHARAVAFIGRDGVTMEITLAPLLGDMPLHMPLQQHPTLEAAVQWCFAQAQAGDAVLLSPACASLDMFRNYSHRAEVFVHAVQALVADGGQV